MPSIVIAAHNESTVIGRCLDAILHDARPGEFDVTVVANGCTDDTAEVARSRSEVRVVELPEPGKARALNHGDAVAIGFPRIYLDADVVISGAGLRRLVDVLDQGMDGEGAAAPLAVSPRRALELRGRPLLVRAYFAIHGRLPAFRDALFGRGAIALSELGRQRFDRFPELVADDLFLDGLFRTGEKREVHDVVSVVATPTRTDALIQRLTRVRRANAAIRAAAPDHLDGAQIRDTSPWSWLRDVVLPRPWLAPAGACYAAITLLAALRARRGSADSWERDDSTRSAPTETHPPAGR